MTMDGWSVVSWCAMGIVAVALLGLLVLFAWWWVEDRRLARLYGPDDPEVECQALNGGGAAWWVLVALFVLCCVVFIIEAARERGLWGDGL